MSRGAAGILAAALLLAAASAGHAEGGARPAQPAPIEGTTYDFTYDGKDIGHPERAWHGRAFLPKKAAGDPSKALPLLVFVHGLNTAKIKYRWMGGGNEGDVRRIVADMIDAGQIPPMIVAGPSTIVPQNMTVSTTSWMALDLDHFIAQTASALSGAATIDRSKIIVAGHSGAGCNIKGGIVTAMGAKQLHGVLSIDTCMGADLASALAQAKKATHVVVSWQAVTWGDRPFSDFKATFEREVKKAPADAGVLRALDLMTPKEPMPHDAMVKLTLNKYLPLLVPPAKVAAAAATSPGTASPAAPTAPPSASPAAPPSTAAPSAPPAPAAAPATRDGVAAAPAGTGP